MKTDELVHEPGRVVKSTTELAHWLSVGVPCQVDLGSVSIGGRLMHKSPGTVIGIMDGVVFVQDWGTHKFLFDDPAICIRQGVAS